MKLIGVDVGGTFTDIVFTDTETGRTIIHKAPTTPDDPSHGVITGVGELCERFGLVRGEIDHGLCRKFCSGGREGVVTPAGGEIRRPGSRTVRPQ